MWFWYGFAAAGVGAVSIIINKRALGEVSARVLTLALFTVSIPFLLILAVSSGVPHLNAAFFIGVIGSSLAFVVAKTITNESIKQSLLSHIFPLTAFGSLFTYVLGVLFLSEYLTMPAVIGLVTVALGAYMLNAQSAREDILKPFRLLLTDRHSFLYILAMFLAALSSIFDKVAVRSISSAGVLWTLLGENVIMSALLILNLRRTETHWTRGFRRHFGILFMAGMVYAGLAYLVLSGFLVGPVALVTGIKRLQIVFVLLLSHVLLGDRATKHVWLGTLIMIAGVVLLRL
ncbi:EamA family transporter [Candidatus Gottesmanbacteria bacterium]|nr:EamA family transporter [Candidatus Gottesmanbacteria bacterium]